MSEEENNWKLVERIADKEKLSDTLKQTLKEIGRRTLFRSQENSEEKVYNFTILTGKNYDGTCQISIHVSKGSLMTHTWNNFSRFDDHYHWKYTNADGVVFDLLHCSGLNQSECSIQDGSCNWIKLREIMIHMNITTVGLCMFTTLLGHLLLTLPYFANFGDYIIPMPATYMFNYLVCVATSPVELSRHVLTCLYFGTNSRGAPAPVEQQLYKVHVDALVHQDGSGIRLNQHFILQVGGGHFVLHPNLPTSTLKKSIIRVVEIRESVVSNGNNRLIAVLEELVTQPGHPYAFSLNRFVVRDVPSLIAATDPANATRYDVIELCGKEEFSNILRLKTLEHQQYWPRHNLAGLLKDPSYSQVDFLKSPTWGREGHIAICDALLGRSSKPPDTDNVSSHEPTPQGKAAMKTDAAVVTRLLQRMATKQGQAAQKKFKAAEKSAMQRTSTRKTPGGTTGKHRLLTYRETPESTNSDQRKLSVMKAATMATQPKPEVPIKRLAKVEPPQILLAAGDVIYMSIQEWFTMAAPCLSDEASKLFVRGEVVMSSRNNTKFTISFPRLGPFMDDSVLTRSNQYLEKRALKELPAGCREPTAKELRVIFKD